MDPLVQWTPTQLVKWISQEFKRHDLPEPHRFEAELLVAHALNITRLEIYLKYDQPTTQYERSLLKNLTKRRLQREPLSYILGSSQFWNLDLCVGNGVLSPRSETELLVEAAIGLIPSKRENDSPYKILELGTGSAAIPLAISSNRQNLTIITVDISKKALIFAEQNISKYHHITKENRNKIIPLRGDGLYAIKPTMRYDMLISNPPYIPDDQFSTLQQEVRDWEPQKALLAGKHGLDFFYILKTAAENLLESSGYLLFEHGFDQKNIISAIFSESVSLNFIASLQDYNHHNRMMIFQKK